MVGRGGGRRTVTLRAGEAGSHHLLLLESVAECTVEVVSWRVHRRPEPGTSGVVQESVHGESYRRVQGCRLRNGLKKSRVRVPRGESVIDACGVTVELAQRGHPGGRERACRARGSDTSRIHGRGPKYHRSLEGR